MAFGAGKYDTSAFMAGEIAVSVVLIESNGEIDESTEDWTANEISKVMTHITNACNWWEEMWSRQGFVGDLHFNIDWEYALTPFQSGYEPITHTVNSEDRLWISEYLTSQGYSGLKDVMMYDYNNDLISNNGADFAFTIFVVKSDNDSDHKFVDNHRAYTWGGYSGGSSTYVTMAYSAYYDWYTAGPFAHEIGHIFGAADEYAGQGNYDDTKGYYGVQNTNAVDGNPNPENIVISLMNTSLTKAYSQYTSSPQSLEMIGWRDSDDDGIIDVLDAPILVTDFSSSLQLANSRYSFSGKFTVDKNKNYDGTKAITINTVDRLLYRYGEDAEWIAVNTTDWGVESKKIIHEFELPSNSVLQWKVVDASGRTESKTYTIGNVSNPQTQVEHETCSATLSFNPATEDTGIVKYLISVDSQTYNINTNNMFELQGLAYGDHQWGIQGMYSDSSVTDRFFCGSFKVSLKVVSTSIQGGKSGGSWGKVSNLQDYVVQYSQDNYQTAVSLPVTGTSLSIYNLDKGKYQWRIQCLNSQEWSDGQQFTVSENAETQVFSALEDGIFDVFFAHHYDIWSNGYRARHQGSLNGWEGTAEKASLDGKNQITDVFRSSADANLLCLTDDANGDALFVDDIYSELPGNLTEQQARVARIDEIRAGDGDDIVDLTSQRFEYVGGGLTVRGGLGNDVIWASNGDNTLFGDAGDDRLVGASGNDIIVGGAGDDSLHGGGGDDIFAFGGNWGNDSVEQLATGKVTLWFENGNVSKWNGSTLTYTDGGNSVKVSGVALNNITLKFGDNGSDQFAKLFAANVFAEFTSKEIFENKGMLA